MIIFRDIVSGDELFTDSQAYKVIENDSIYEIKCNLVVRREGEIVLAGANPSAEEADEGTDDLEQRGLDIVLNHRLVETSYKKSDFKTYLKTYGKALIEKLNKNEAKPEEVETAKKKLQEGVKWLLGQFDDMQLFMGENMDPDGTLVFVKYEEDGSSAKAYAFAAGIESEKV